jgi:hypothetical protein
MKKSRRFAALALGLSLGLAGFGPAALAQRDHHDHPHHDHPDQPDEPDQPEPEVEAASCSTSMENSSDNSTGTSQQSGLINVNNIALQGLNLDLLGNLLCQGVFLNDVVGSVLGVVGLGGGDDNDAPAGDGSCNTAMDNSSTNGTGNSAQDGLINVNNIALQGINLDVLGNALCQADFLNDLNVAILGTILHPDGNDDVAAAGGDSDDDGSCNTSMSNDSDNDTGTSVMGGLLNINNIALQGLNVPVLSNGLCGSIFLNDLLVSVLGIL